MQRTSCQTLCHVNQELVRFNFRFRGYLYCTLNTLRTNASTTPTLSVHLLSFVLSQTNNLVEHNLVLCGINIDTEVGCAQRLEAHKGI